MPTTSSPLSSALRWSLFVALALAGCGGDGAKTTPRIAVPAVPDRATVIQGATLGPGDVVEIRVYQENDLTGLFRLASDGTFEYPLVGRVEAKGLTPGTLSALLVDRLKAGYLRNPQVTVFVKEFNSKKIFVLGEVNKPGTFVFEDNMSIVQAITQAGGFKSLAAKDRIVLTRVEDGVEKKYVVPVEQIGLGKEQNLLLQPGDIIFVPETWL